MLPSDAHQLAEGARRGAEQRVGVLPTEHGHARLLPHVQVAQVAPDQRLDVV